MQGESDGANSCVVGGIKEQYGESRTVVAIA